MGDTWEGTRKDQIPIHSELSPQVRFLNSGERRPGSLSAFQRFGWIFVASSTRQVHNDEFQAPEAKHRIPRWWRRPNLLQDLTSGQRMQLRLHQTKSSRERIAVGDGLWLHPDHLESCPVPLSGPHDSPSGHFGSKDIESPLLDIFREPFAWELGIVGPKSAPSEVLARAAEPEESDGPRPGRFRPLGASRERPAARGQAGPWPGGGPPMLPSSRCGPPAAACLGFVNSIHRVVSVCIRALYRSLRLISLSPYGDKRISREWSSCGPDIWPRPVAAPTLGKAPATPGRQNQEPGLQARGSSARGRGAARAAPAGAVAGATTSWRLLPASRRVAPDARQLRFPCPGPAGRLLKAAFLNRLCGFLTICAVSDRRPPSSPLMARPFLLWHLQIAQGPCALQNFLPTRNERENLFPFWGCGGN